MAKRKHYPMAGLEMYGSGLAEGPLDTEALGLFRMSNEEAMEHGIAVLTGAASIVAISTALSMWKVPEKNEDGTPFVIETEMVDGQPVQVGMYAPQNFQRIKNGITLATAIVVGKLVYNENKVAGTAIVAGLGGLALAELIASFVGNSDAVPATATAPAIPSAPYLQTQLHGVNQYPQYN